MIDEPDIDRQSVERRKRRRHDILVWNRQLGGGFDVVEIQTLKPRGWPRNGVLALEFGVRRGVLDGKLRVRRRSADDELSAIRLSQDHLRDLLLRDVDDTPLEPTRNIPRGIERAPGEPSLRVAR